jgi:hypothetical protein
MTRKKLVIILPVLNDTASLAILVKDLAVLFEESAAATSLVIVDDGSLPSIAEVVDRELCDTFSGQVLTLTRNVGPETAIAVGIAYAVAEDIADRVLIMDSDGEDTPADALRLLEELDRHDSASVVVGRRTKRNELWPFKVMYQAYRLIFSILTGRQISFGNFSAMSLAAASRLADMSELWTHLPATILLSRLSIVEVPTAKGPRYVGQPRMNLVSLVTHGLSAVSVFLRSALTRMILAASALVAICILISVTAIVLKLIGMATPGWMTTVVGVSLILMLGVAILCFIGLCLTIIGGPHTTPAPNATFRSFVKNVVSFGPDASPSHRASTPTRHGGTPA